MSQNDLDPDEVLANYSSTQLQCRVDRHRWSRKAYYHPDERNFVPGFSRRYQTCQDCGMQRWKEVDIRTFEYTGRYGYLPPRGYYTPGTGLTLADFSERLYREEYAAALKAGRVVEYRDRKDEATPPLSLDVSEKVS